MKNKFLISLFIFLIMTGMMAGCSILFGEHQKTKTDRHEAPVKGLWVTAFSAKKVLYSQKAVKDLIDYCKKNDISEIYLQIFRSGEAYYDSTISTRKNYSEILKQAGCDTIDLILKKAKAEDIKVFAWINILSLAQNTNAPIIEKFDKSVLTRDQYLRESIKTNKANDTDKYYLRDAQLFLEPGDERVVQYMLETVEEIIKRYPSFSGIHLDYIRYPYAVPFIPDSRFLRFGLGYGFGEHNINRFIQKTGINPLKGDMYKNDLYLMWDNWKRDQITNLVKQISFLVRKQAKNWQVSCAVVPGFERAYSIAYQDWPLWLEKKLIDYVILMNYTKDERFAQENIRGALAYRNLGRIYVGIGAFLFENASDAQQSLKTAKKFNPDGIVVFNYDAASAFNLQF